MKKRNFFPSFFNIICAEIEIEERLYKFLIDTGSEYSYITSNIHLKKYEISLDYILRVNGIGGKIDINRAYKIPKLRINNKAFQEEVFFQKETNNILFKLLNIDGIIGWNMLKNYDYLIDFNRMSLQFIDKKDYNIDLVNDYYNFSMLHNKKIATYVSFEHGEQVTFLVDLGSTSSHFHSISHRSLYKKPKITIGINGLEIGRVYKLKSLKLKDWEDNIFVINNLIFEKYDSKVLYTIGTNNFKNKKLLFLNTKDCLYIERGILYDE